MDIRKNSRCSPEEMEIMDYQIKSKYIKNKIRGQSYKNTDLREYINDLVFLEESITEGIRGWSGNMKLFGLKNRYEKEKERLDLP